MEDERRGNVRNVGITESPESSSNITIPTSHVTTSTLTIISNNVNSSISSSNKEQDRFLPIANVGRIMKKVIPGNGKISKDAKETVQECVSEFISFVTGEASDKCQREKRKTINGDDIIWAITMLGFEDYVAPLKHYLNKYRELEGEKLNVPKQQQHDQNQKSTFSYNSTLYSPTGLLSQPSFVPADQSFPLPFSPNSIHSQLPKQEHVDSMGHW
ncbi:Nuclear transcription factor Y subunit B-7 [Datura stramonium]|uniref:Nuclear transcription factor Y subunit B-7 n=1 Tax=Datura stramonium TaxID=4076 RepID=A0ABS8T7C7_DATST|nr:Nuclear transcription factor Y subunit B-7 [Datura stramonium]